MCPSSGENYFIHATLVLVTLYGWRLVCWLEFHSNQQIRNVHLVGFICGSRSSLMENSFWKRQCTCR